MLITALLLGGCSAQDQQTSSNPDSMTESQSGSGETEASASDSPAGSATVSAGGREFSFQLTRCLVYEEREVELAGPGAEVGSSVSSYFDGGLMQMGTDALGELRVDIGADGPFQSSDEFIAIGAPTGGDFSVTKTGHDYLATGKSWDNDGTDLGTGTVQFSCK